MLISRGLWHRGIRLEGSHSIRSRTETKNGSFPFCSKRSAAVNGKAAYRGHPVDPPILLDHSGIVGTVHCSVGANRADSPAGSARSAVKAIVDFRVRLEPIAVIVKIEATEGIRGHSPLSPRLGPFADDLAVTPLESTTRLGIIHPVIDRVVQSVLGVLNVAWGRLGIFSHWCSLVSDKVAIGVFAKQKISVAGCHQRASRNNRNTPGIDDFVEEGRRFIHPPITIGILKHLHPANRIIRF